MAFAGFPVVTGQEGVDLHGDDQRSCGERVA